jgi:hypothetical protein
MIQVAVALGIADSLHDGPKPATKLVTDSGADANMVLRLCRALSAFGIFEVNFGIGTRHPTEAASALIQKIPPLTGIVNCAIDVRAMLTKLVPLNWDDLKRLAERSCCGLRRPERWHRLARRSGSRPCRRRWYLGAQVLIGSLGNE